MHTIQKAAPLVLTVGVASSTAAVAKLVLDAVSPLSLVAVAFTSMV